MWEIFKGFNDFHDFEFSSVNESIFNNRINRQAYFIFCYFWIENLTISESSDKNQERVLTVLQKMLIYFVNQIFSENNEKYCRDKLLLNWLQINLLMITVLQKFIWFLQNLLGCSMIAVLYLPKIVTISTCKITIWEPGSPFLPAAHVG